MDLRTYGQYYDDAVLTTDSETLAHWHTGSISLGQAMHGGRMTVTGPRHLIRELAGWGMGGRSASVVAVPAERS